ncbi:DUF1489 domain-containing protein [Acuticoccus sediminis]|uniref:DUF1489 domain-containing protein n=1 Tax=Acuticoccus sediminis TaxID=2184697 RepID=A0A8B2P233_9HYPH|nr:DUF1489 domain-containing protein [Acuticoccus sediminis]RAI04014.1 DUF1489 domain-containing protein [Acuticoccus sediminis]
MTVHLLKLCVGVTSIDELRQSAERRGGADPSGAMRITTRMAPKRADEVLDEGSLYWVIKGSVQARQRVVGIEPFTDGAGVGRVHILLEPDVVAVRPRPCRAFQGWRYLRADEAPADFSLAAVDEAMPAAMRRDLLELCLI